LIKGKRILGSWGGATDPDRDIPRYVDLYMRGKLNIDPLITHRCRLNEINSAFDKLRSDENVIRILIEF
jgi:S-(hydroxymethyl)glutathione dehydrogenase/alcohol dehydrogenase